jgi:DNA-binding transcriptional LysR family regulator
VAVNGPVIASSRTFTLEAALAGAGIGFLKEGAIASYLADGLLVPLLEAWSAPFPGFHLCYPQRRHMAPALGALVHVLRFSVTAAQEV